MKKNVKKVNKTSYAAPAVDRMLDIMEFLSEQNRPYGVTELSRKLNISTNLVFRIMKRMTERGYAELDPESGGYQLSTRFFSLGMRLYSRFELRQRALKHLEELCRETGETCQIQIPDGDKMLVLDSINPAADFFLHVVPGSRVYYHPNAFGKSILAFKDKNTVKSMLSGKMPKLTNNTVSSLMALDKQFSEIRQTGLAYDHEEYSVGIYCIGAPVFNVSEEAVAGIGMTGLASRFDRKKCTSLEQYVLECAAKIATDIGYTGNFYQEKL